MLLFRFILYDILSEHGPIRKSPGPKPFSIIRLLHQRWRDSGIDLRGREPFVPHLLLNHGHGNAGHERIYHMAVSEDMGRDLLSGELLPGRDLLDPSLFSQPFYGPENSLCAQVAGAPAREEPLLAGLQALLDGL